MLQTQNSQAEKENTQTIVKLKLQTEANQNENKVKEQDQMKTTEKGGKQINDGDEDNKDKDNIIANIDCPNQPQYFKQVEMQVVPILRHLKTNCVYMLSGDVMVDLDLGSYIYPKNNSDRASCCEISALNSFKNPIRVAVFGGQSEVEMTISQQGIGDFRNIIEILSNYPEQRAHNFGIILSKYQQYVDCQQKKAAFLSKDASFQQIVPALDQAFHDFLDESRDYLKNEFSIQNKFFFQLIVRPNVSTFTNDIARAGISEQLCQLLGGSSKQIGSLILRRGLFEFFSKSARNNFYFSYLSLFLNIQLEGIDDQVSLITLDGIEVTVKFQMMNYFGKKPSPNVLFYHPYTMIIISFDVTPEILEQVAEIRRTSPNTNNLIQEFAQDIYYSLESQIFLENFYADQLHRIDLNNGQPLPPVKRKYKKHKLSRNALGFRVQTASAEGNTKIIRKNNHNIQESSREGNLSEVEDSSKPQLNALPLNKKSISKRKGNSKQTEQDQSVQINGDNYEEIYQANSENTFPSVSAQQNQLSSQITQNTLQ